MVLKKLILTAVIAISAITCKNKDEKSIAISKQQEISNPTNKVVSIDDLEWGALNSARGDNSPRAANLWGDRTAEGATGFLVKFKEGFSSPPHIHNVTYRAMVIDGELHNDDADAANMWMPQGSFWTQPKGEPHITAARATSNMAYVEIEEGPYLVKPVSEAFDSGERPLNVDRSNLVWFDSDFESVARAFLWGKPQSESLSGTLVKLPTGFKGQIKSLGSEFNAVIIEGKIDYQMPDEAKKTTLKTGSSFSSEGESIHEISSTEETLIYVRTNGKFEVVSE